MLNTDNSGEIKMESMRIGRRLYFFDRGRLAEEGRLESAGETRDCTVRAISFACGVTYDEAHRLLAANGRKFRHGFHTIPFLQGLMNRGERLFGYKVTAVALKSLYPNLRRVQQDYRSGTFLVRKRSHLFALVDGVISDNTGLRSGVLNVWRLEKETVETAPVAAVVVPQNVPAVAAAETKAFSVATAIERYQAGMKVVDIAVSFGYKRGTGQNRVRAALIKAGVYKK